MAGIYGADIVQLRALGKALNDASARMASAKNLLSGHVRASAAWKGSDANGFRTDWDARHRVLLEQVIQGLAAAGRIASANADEQEKASAGSGTGPVVGGAGKGNTPFERLADRADHSVPRHPDQGQSDLSNEELAKLKGLVRDAGENNDLLEGNDKDVNELRDALAALKPAQLDQLLKSLSDDELKQLAEGSASDGKGLFNWEGTTPFEKHQLLDQLLSKASPEQVDRLKELFPWAQPDGEAMGDSARPGGADPSTTNQWMDPTAPVIGQHPSKDDIRQGQYGDCVVMAAAGAMINADPNWAKDHVTDNGNGTVSVRLFDKSGNEQWVTVTSDLPANTAGGQLGAKPGQDGNWPAYIEKALSQVYTEDDNRDPTKEGAPRDIAHEAGNYRAIEGNYGPDAFRYLVGPDVEQTSDADVLWRAAGEGKPSLVTTLGETPEGAPVGYHAGHAYFVTGSDERGNIILQNPWRPEEPQMSISKVEFSKLFYDATVSR